MSQTSGAKLRKQRSRHEIKQVLDEQELSRQSVQKYCKERHISPNTFYSACLSSSILVLISNGVTHTALLFICDVLLVFACSVVDVKFSRRDRTARHDSYKDIIS